MASSTRSRSVSVTAERLYRAGVDRAEDVRSGDREHESRTPPFAPSRRVRLDQGAVEHLTHVVDRYHLDGVEDLPVDLVQIAQVLGRQDERLQPGPVRGEQLVLHASDGKHLAAQG